MFQKNYLIIMTFWALSLATGLPSNNFVHQRHDDQFQQPSVPNGAGHGVNKRTPLEEEKLAVVLQQAQEASEDGKYHFGFETSSGIRVEESGNPINAQGGFTYKGDDGKTYITTYTAGEDGFKPQGEHIPVPPPIPQAILEALKKNEQDEAAGIFDDGKYHP